MSSEISVDIGSSSYSSPEYIVSIYYSLINGGIIELSSDSSLISESSQVSDHKFPSSNCANVIIFPVCSLEDVSQGMYDTSDAYPSLLNRSVTYTITY